MFSTTRRSFASRIACLFTGMGAANLFGGSAHATTEEQGGVHKLGYDGKPTDGTGFITPLIVHNGVIYIAGQGAHSHDPDGKFPTDMETHTKKVLDNVKTLVEAGGGTMDSILQLTVFLTKIEDFDDVEARNGWKDRVLSGQVSADLYLKTLRKMSRDNARTPVQWDSTAQGGFTAGPKPWLPVNPNFREINAAQEQGDPRSVYNFYRELLALRKKTPALIYGDYKDLDPQHPSVFAYTRVLGSDKFVMTINLSNKAASYRLPAAMSQGKQVLNNLGRTGDSGGDLHLEAWEARIYQF